MPLVSLTFKNPLALIRHASALALALLLTACASTEPQVVKEEPDPRFSGVISPGEVRGERSAQVLGALEARLLQAFPRANWLVGKSAQADLVLDVNVYSAKTTESRSSQEQRLCRRWSDPDKDAKGTLQRMASRSCLDWQVQQIPCLNRRYELDVQVRARQRGAERILASDRKVAASSDRQCGSDIPSSAALQASAEAEIAAWTTTLLRPVLAELAAPSNVTMAPLNPAGPKLEAVSSAAPQQSAAAALPTVSTARPVEAHALVIGNAGYPGSARLVNPLNDAQAVARKFAELGFQVSRIDDADRETLVRGLSLFQQRAASSQITVLYYSGHGMQIDGMNYLMPVNIDINKPGTLKLQALPLDTIVESYLPGRTRIVFLDACRDNPSVSGSVRGFSRGLAPIQAPAGTLIAYATRDGGVAEDGTGQHSPFTQALLDLIAEPEDISLILRRVRDRVMRETSGRQQPWEYGSLSGGSLVLSRLRSQ